MKNLPITILIVSIFIISLSACAPPPTPTAEGQLANPAAVYCQEQGNTYEIRSDEAGNQYGVCIFPDGSECEEWAYFRGECGPQASSSSKADTVNLVEAANLQNTTRIDIYIPGTLSPDPEVSQSPRDGTFHLLLSITDSNRIAEIIRALDTPLTLGPRHRCLSYYSLQFHVGDQIVEFGYGCAPDKADFLRGDQPYFNDMDAATPSEFNTLLRDLIHQETPPMTSDISPDELTQAVQGNTEFAIELYQQLHGEKNLFFSPHSISLALAMTYAGARGETAAQMAQTLHFNLPESQLHAALAQLSQELASRSQLPPWMLLETPEDEQPTAFQLRIVNALWGQKDYPFEKDYVKLLTDIYGANLNLTDFVHDPDGARQEINDWVSEQTQDKIKDLLPPGSIDELTRLVLTNAIYFKAAWAQPFSEEVTQDGTFTHLDSSTSIIPFMQQTGHFAYAVGDDATIISLPYLGDALTMLIVMPDAGGFEQYAATLDISRWTEIQKTLRMGEVELSMPKFSFESGFALKDTLAAMGMPLPFSNDADFSGMSAQDTSLPPELLDLHISNVYHKAFVDVNEAGTEAAAATAVVMALKSAVPSEPVTIILDHPFIFAIYDRPTGEILFMGQVVSP